MKYPCYLMCFLLLFFFQKGESVDHTEHTVNIKDTFCDTDNQVKCAKLNGFRWAVWAKSRVFTVIVPAI